MTLAVPTVRKLIKQFPVALGVLTEEGKMPGGEPLEMLREIPHYIKEANPAIAAIGIISLLIMFFWPMIGKRIGPLKAIPSPMVVLLVALAAMLVDHSVMENLKKWDVTSSRRH